MKNILSLLVLFVGVSTLYEAAASEAGVLKEYEDTLELSRVIMGRVEKDDYTGAYNKAAEYWPLPRHEIDAAAYQTNQQAAMIQARFGKPIGVEFVSRHKAGTSFAREWYIQKFENHALVWMFTYYYGTNGWALNGMEFSDDISVLFY